MKTRKFALCLATVFLVAIYINIQRSHTFTLSNDEGTIKTEQIQPLWGTVKVSGDCDTEVVFTDVETGEKYRIGYITQGVTERIKLERGKWYKVAGGGNLTLNPVNPCFSFSSAIWTSISSRIFFRSARTLLI